MMILFSFNIYIIFSHSKLIVSSFSFWWGYIFFSVFKKDISFLSLLETLVFMEA